MTAFRSHAFALSFLLSALRAEVGVAFPTRPNVVSEMPLSEEGYQQIAAMKSDGDMKEFIRRVLSKFGFKVADEGELSGFTKHYSGTSAVQDFQRLEEELQSVPWVSTSEAEELASPSVTPINEGAVPESMGEAARQVAHAKAASPKTTPAAAAKKRLVKLAAAKSPKEKSSAREPQEVEEVAEHVSEEVEGPAHVTAKLVKAAPVAAASKAKQAAKRKDAPAGTQALKGKVSDTPPRAAANKAAAPSRGKPAPALARSGAMTKHAAGARLEKGSRGAPNPDAEGARASEAGGHSAKPSPAGNAKGGGRGGGGRGRGRGHGHDRDRDVASF